MQRPAMVASITRITLYAEEAGVGATGIVFTQLLYGLT
jgi:hypothetical protein